MAVEVAVSMARGGIATQNFQIEVILGSRECRRQNHIDGAHGRATIQNEPCLRPVAAIPQRSDLLETR